MNISELYIKKPNCYTFYYKIQFVNLNGMLIFYFSIMNKHEVIMNSSMHNLSPLSKIIYYYY